MLEVLEADELRDALSVAGTAEAWVAILSQREEMHVVREALNTGALQEITLRFYVHGLLNRLERGHMFEFDAAVSAIAVALMERPTQFAEDLLVGLSKLRVAEIPMSPRVALLCLHHRTRLLAHNTQRTVTVASAIGGSGRVIIEEPYRVAAENEVISLEIVS